MRARRVPDAAKSTGAAARCRRHQDGGAAPRRVCGWRFAHRGARVRRRGRSDARAGGIGAATRRPDDRTEPRPANHPRQRRIRCRNRPRDAGRRCAGGRRWQLVRHDRGRRHHHTAAGASGTRSAHVSHLERYSAPPRHMESPVLSRAMGGRFGARRRDDGGGGIR